MKKYIEKPFDIELAKAITSGEVEGRIRTKKGEFVRIVCNEGESERITSYTSIGTYTIDGNSFGYNDLILEVLEEVGEPEPVCDFKPFDRVLVRDEDDEKWGIELFNRFIPKPNAWNQPLYQCIAAAFFQCIPYEGNEHLLGTTDSPDDVKKEEEEQP